MTSLARFAAGVAASLVTTLVLGTLAPGLGLLIAGFLAGAVAGAPLPGALAALLGSLPLHLIAAKLVSPLLVSFGCKCNPLLVAILAAAAETLAGLIGGLVASRASAPR